MHPRSFSRFVARYVLSLQGCIFIFLLALSVLGHVAYAQVEGKERVWIGAANLFVILALTAVVSWGCGRVCGLVVGVIGVAVEVMLLGWAVGKDRGAHWRD